MSFLVNAGRPGSFGGGVSSGASSSFDSDAQAWIDQMSTAPNATYEAAYDNFVKDLKTGPTHGTNVWAELDAIYVLAAHAAQAAHLNVKDPTGTALTPVNSPTFTAGQGYAGNGAGYLNTGFNPSVDGSNFTLNSAIAGVYVRQVGVGNDAYLGAFGSNLNSRTALEFTTSSLLQTRGPNSNLSSYSSSTVGNGELWVSDRVDAGRSNIYKDGSLHETNNSSESNILTDADIYLLAENGNGSVRQVQASGQLSLALFGGSLTANQHADLDAAVDNLKTAIGF